MQDHAIEHKPDSFVAVFAPKDRPARPVSTLGYQVTVETAQYAATIHYGERELLTTSADGQQILLLAGTIYRPQNVDLIDLYERRGLDFIADLNGDFCLLLIDRRADLIAFATDRVNSFKLLVSWDAGALTLSNSIYLQPVRGAAIDRAAVAGYLAASYSYNDRTLYEHVKMLDSGSIYRLADGRLDQRKYWRYRFAEPSTASPETLRRDLGDLLIEATRLRYCPDQPTFLSLSAGYDSTAVLGLLANVLRAPDVRCFSYGHGEAQQDSDEVLAGRLAAVAGYGHEIIPAFDGSITRTLERNARFGGGMTRFCDEVDAWLRLGTRPAKAPMPTLFTGDMLMLKADWEIRTVEDVVAAARMRDFSVLAWLEPLIGRARYRELLAATHADIETAVQAAPPTRNGEDFRDVLRFDQMHSRVTGTWREYYAARFFRLAHPLLDNDILDFTLRLPTHLRRGKILFRDTVTAMFPQLFAVPRASSAGYATYWPEVLVSQKTALQTLIRGQASPLDDVIAPDILLALLAADRPALTRSNALARSALKQAYALLQRTRWHRSALTRPSLFTPAVSADHFLKRALTLRCFLAEMETSL